MKKRLIITSILLKKKLKSQTKTQYSFSTDPSLKGAPTGHALPIREIRLSSGAEFIVVVCGAVMTMPGLPRVPAADSIKLNKDGEIEGLF